MLVAIGGLAGTGPLYSFLELSDDLSSSWEKQYGKPPYNHAELSSLSAFSKKMKFDLQDSLLVLKTEGIKIDSPDSTLAKISAEN